MDLRKRQERLSPFPFLNPIFKIGLIIVFLFFCFISVHQLSWSTYFPIKIVRVYGVNRLDQQEVQHVLRPLLHKGFFGVQIERIRDRLLQMPWISQLYVRRIWPDRIEITVMEKKPIANWNKGSLLSDEGELFSPPHTTYPDNLPQFVGPDGKQIVMLGYFNQINRILSPIHVKISYLEMSPFLTLKLALNNGITMHMGHEDILTRLDHFVKVYPKIVGDRAAEIEYIDLRYPNGMAVRWKALTIKA